MAERTGTRALKFVFADLIGDFFYFPVWWYTRGLAKMALAAFKRVAGIWTSLGVGVWTRNLFVPMFGQVDIPGRVISFFVRLFQIIFRTVWFVLAVVFQIVWLLVWAAIPAFIVLMILISFVNLFRI